MRVKLTRAELEETERTLLAAYACRSGETKGRAYPEAEHPLRSAFQRDRDRIVHSAAFRKLEYKTQVFVNHEGDNFRTRLTHSMEVAQIARSVARSLRLNEDLTETIALAHDIGHTPFGHAGEEALNECLQDEGGFEHNSHGYLVVTELEQKYPEFPGLNLTFEVRDAISKHSTHYDHPRRTAGGEHDTAYPCLEGQIVDAADSIAYNNHDIEDSINMGIMTVETFKGLDIWREVVEDIERRYSSSDMELTADKLRLQAVRGMIDRQVSDLIERSAELLRESGADCVDDVLNADSKLISFSPPMEEHMNAVKEFLLTKVYNDYRVARMTGKAKRFLKELFQRYVEDPRLVDARYHPWVEKYGLKRGVGYHIAGLTDRELQDEYRKLFQPFEKV